MAKMLEKKRLLRYIIFRFKNKGFFMKKMLLLAKKSRTSRLESAACYISSEITSACTVWWFP